MMCGQIQTLKSHQKQARPPHIPPNPHAQHQTRGPTGADSVRELRSAQKGGKKHHGKGRATPTPLRHAHAHAGRLGLAGSTRPQIPGHRRASVRPRDRPRQGFFLKKKHTHRDIHGPFLRVRDAAPRAAACGRLGRQSRRARPEQDKTARARPAGPGASGR